MARLKHHVELQGASSYGNWNTTRCLGFESHSAELVNVTVGTEGGMYDRRALVTFLKQVVAVLER